MEEVEWEPKTQLGKMVRNGEIKNIADIFKLNLPIMEPEIVDVLLADTKEEVLDINIVQRMHKSGRRVRFRATVAFGNENGYVGLGMAVSKEVGPAIRKAIRNAKLNLVQIRRGCGSWECGCATHHSVPFAVTGQSGSVRITLLPAPRGVGMVINENAKKILKLAGITDVWSKTGGKTKTTINSAQATFEALRNTGMVKILNNEQRQVVGLVDGRVD